MLKRVLLSSRRGGDSPRRGGESDCGVKLDASLRARAATRQGTSRVIIETTDGSGAENLIRSLKGKPGRRLGLLRGQVADIPNAALEALADRPSVRAVRLDRRVTGTMERTGATIGATGFARTSDWRRGVGVAISIRIHLVARQSRSAASSTSRTSLISCRWPREYGHGTHVAGIISGSGYDSNGARRGVAPAANLVVLKVLDGDGYGYISNVIAALDYAVEHRAQFNIRVINLSVAAGVHESYNTDPLTLAAKRAVQAGVVSSPRRQPRRNAQRRSNTAASQRLATPHGCSPSEPRATTAP